MNLPETENLTKLLQENADLDLMSTADAAKVVKKWLVKKQKEVSINESNPLRKMCRLALLIELQEAI